MIVVPESANPMKARSCWFAKLSAIWFAFVCPRVLQEFMTFASVSAALLAAI